MFWKPEFPIHSEIKPWNMRLIVALGFAGAGTACYFTGGPWLVLVAGVPSLWMFIRAPHHLFTLDEEAIAWSNNLKRKPLTRILLAYIREVYLVESSDAEGSNGLAVIDLNGVTHLVGTNGSPGADHVWSELKRLCPTARFGYCRDRTTISCPSGLEKLKDMFG